MNTDSKLDSTSEAISAVVGLFLIVPLAFWRAFVLWKLWTWHAAPLVVPLGFWTVFGLDCLRSVIVGTGKPQKDSPGSVAILAWQIASAFVLLLALAFGWFASVQS